ncbi:MAG TPA: hypothetical protein VM118_12580, partial [Acidobacteriota bacterium]|nr:hypothetical protein [Acidobacteriota bacterium]
MRQIVITGCLTAVGVLILVGASGTETTDPVAVMKQLGVPDSFAERWTEPYVPLWALRQKAPVVQVADSAGATAAGMTAAGTVDCASFFSVTVSTSDTRPRDDSQRGITELYTRNYDDRNMLRIDVAADLSYDTDTLPVDAAPWVATDLDQDGNLELVTQENDALMIFSAPDWLLRNAFVWPGFLVQMNAEGI